jgi:tellurite resistance protein TehA-like permease
MSRHLHGEQDAVSRSPVATALRNFSSQWVLVAQGTGIMAVVLHQLDYQFNGLIIISEIIWVYTIILLFTSVLLYTIRTIIYPQHVKDHLTTSLLELTSLSNIMTTFFSIIEMIALTIASDWNHAWGLVGYILWWITTPISVLACVIIPYINFKHQPPNIPNMTPALLLPFLSALTSAACGGVLAVHGSLSPRLQVPMIIFSYLELGFGYPLALIFDGIFLNRLLHTNAFPSIDIIYQLMILVGPWGQGSFALQILGQAVRKGSFAAYSRGTLLTAEAAPAFSIASQFAGLISWGYASFWCGFACLCIIRCIIDQPGGWRRTKFSVGVWSIVFPLVRTIYPHPYSLHPLPLSLPTYEYIENETMYIGRLHQRSRKPRKTSRLPCLRRPFYSILPHLTRDLDIPTDSDCEGDMDGEVTWDGERVEEV